MFYQYPTNIGHISYVRSACTFALAYMAQKEHLPRTVNRE